MILKVSTDVILGRSRRATSCGKSFYNKRKYLEFKVYPNTSTTVIGWRDSLNFAFQLAGKLI